MQRLHHCLFWIDELLEQDLIASCMYAFWRAELQTIGDGYGSFRKETRRCVMEKTECGCEVYMPVNLFIMRLSLSL